MRAFRQSIAEREALWNKLAQLSMPVAVCTLKPAPHVMAEPVSEMGKQGVD